MVNGLFMSTPVGTFTQLKFSLAEKLFHSSFLRHSRFRHQWIMRLFKEAANEGHLKALSMYGHLLFFRGVTPVDKGQGINYLLDAAKQGDAKAQYQIACIYESGYGHLLKSTENAVRWFVRAAEQNHPLACRRMAKACEKGELGLVVNMEQALFWSNKVKRFSEPATAAHLSFN